MSALWSAGHEWSYLFGGAGLEHDIILRVLFLVVAFGFRPRRNVKQHAFQTDIDEGRKAALEIEKASQSGLLPAPRSSLGVLLAGAS